MQVHYKKMLQASALISLSAVLYGFLGYLGTAILHDQIPITSMLFWRFFIAGCWMLLFVIKKSKKIQPISKNALLGMFLLGAFSYSGSSEFYFIATQYTGTGLAMVIFFSYPVIVALLSWGMQRHHLNRVTLITLGLMMGGLYLLKGPANHPIHIIGIVFATLAALFYAFYVVGSKRFSSVTIDSNILTMTVCFGSASLFLILALAAHRFVFPTSLQNALYFLALGIIATAIPIQLMLEGLKYVTPMRASIISVLEPIVTMVVGIILLNESLTHLQMVGVLIVLGSALLVQFQKEL